MIKIIEIPLYHGELVLIQKKKLEDIPEKYKPENEDFKGYAAVTCFRLKNNGVAQFIIAFLKPTTPSNIAHEAEHCKGEIFNHVGITEHNTNNEPSAYMIGWIVEQCHKYLKIK